jgi:primary replicative DNA helicase (EC 3.6.1.-)
LKKKYNIDIVIIDYLQLMTGPPDLKGNREQEVSVISRSLKGLAKELNVPIIALSQLNRAVESRTGNKRPQLSDLRESGAIEQDADVVCFIHRPEKYGMMVDDDGNSTVGIAEIIVAKHRNGAVGDVRLRFRDEIARFVELDEIEPIDESVSIRPVITKGSRMNEEIISPIDDFKPNTSFDDEPPF